MIAFKQIRLDGYTVRFPLGDEGFEVPFDVEAVLSNQRWIRLLVDKHELTQRENSYFHRLLPVWISRQ